MELPEWLTTSQFIPGASIFYPLRLLAALAIFALVAAPHLDLEAVLRSYLYARRRKLQAATCCSFLLLFLTSSYDTI
jgi:hypothetical protein